MFKVSVFFIAFLALQVRADVVEDAEAALNKLRQATSESLTSAFMEKIALSSQIDSLALEATADAADDVIECVNMHATEAIDYLYTSSIDAADKSLKVSYDEEKELVLCGAADEACISGVIDRVNDYIESIPSMIADAVAEDTKIVQEHIESLKACSA